MIRNAPVSTTAVPAETKSRSAPAGERKVAERPPETQNVPSPITPPQNTPASRPPRSRPVVKLILLLLLAVSAGAGWYFRTEWLPKISVLFAAKEVAPKKPRDVPVVTAKATTRDLKIYLNGLGTVTALKTATIRSRVDGEIINIPFEEGQIVEKGALLAELDSRPFEVQRDQAAGQLARDEATLKSAKVILGRYHELLKSNGISKQEFDTQESIVQQTEGLVKSDQAMVANAELQITYCRIISPFKGRVGLRLVDLGNIVRANDPTGIAVINQLDPIAITFTISQDEIPRVQTRIREGKELQVEAYDRDFTTRLARGKLLAIDNQVDSATGTLRLKAIVEEDAAALFPNQFVNTRLLVDTKLGATVVPSAAVQRGPASNFVYVVQDDDTVELRNVVPGPTEGTETSIEEGLKPGEIVVTEGLDKLQPKTKVAPRKPNAKEAETSKSVAPSEKPAEPAHSAK
jgi:multidrug efflux system membrane fusion protein